MPPVLQPVFSRLREILRQQADGCTVARDTAGHFGLDASVGPATLRLWKGKMKSPTMPVAWVQISKAYVGFHLMGVYGNPKLLKGCSQPLLARMHGKSCFNFKAVDEPLFAELAQLTTESIAGMRTTGYIAPREST